MSTDINEIEWAEKLAADKAWVVQVQQRVVGRVVELAWLPGKAAGLTTLQPVLRLEGGHSFHAVRENFIRIEERDFKAYEQMVAALRLVVGELAVLGKSAGMSQPTFELLVGAALVGQANAIGKRAAQERIG